MYGILRVRNLKMGDLKSTEKHNERAEENKRDNICYEDSRFNEYKVGTKSFMHAHKHNYLDKQSLEEVIKSKLEDKNITVKKGQNVAIEVVLTVSKDFHWMTQKTDDLFREKAPEWLAKEFGGKNNIVATYLHHDESNPHLHAIVIPVQEKEIKWKNRHGEGKKTQYSLSAKDFTGSKGKLRDLQTSYYENLKSNYPDHLFPEGEGFKRGVDSNKKARNYERHTRHELADIRHDMSIINQNHKEIVKTFQETNMGVDKMFHYLNEIKKLQEQAKLKTEEANKILSEQKKLNKEVETRRENWKKGERYILGEKLPVKKSKGEKEIKQSKPKKKSRGMGM